MIKIELAIKETKSPTGETRLAYFLNPDKSNGTPLEIKIGTSFLKVIVGLFDLIHYEASKDPQFKGSISAFDKAAKNLFQNVTEGGEKKDAKSS